MKLEEIIRSRRKRLLGVSLVFVLIVLLIILIGLHTGSMPISPLGVWKTLFGYGTPYETMALYEFRLPRILVTMLAGAGLGVAGMVFQGVSRNSLADPGILGVNTGAAFGLIVYISFFLEMNGPMSLMIPLFAFAGGLLVAFIVFLLSYDRYRGLLPIRLILVGIAVAAGFSALTLLLSLRLDDTTYAFAARWLAGNVWGREWVHVWALLPWVVLCFPLIYMQSRKLDLFSLGDEIATGLGNSPTKNRFLLLLLAVALSCASVSVAGGISFIGLAAPHIARRLVGPKHSGSLLITALIGMAVLVMADTAGRSLFRPNEIPAGVIVAALGGPYFLYLLLRKNKFES
ncbi:iron ABC transporter permease [Alkalihalobacillus oceani]|uniref:Iron ABC transporter permease n=1 Tax=Halalkalibacter oceani TaxID=1653776 RepID=A0A9X2DMV3_9BACI|nr:iron ABC transporter permease [Halalkalibacter oceani]MCM3712875.1 iron ABC transporter permease [Halalkalibacter oceani]